MVEVADRRLGPEKRHDPIARERDERRHVVALVGVEATPCGKSGKSEQCRNRDGADEGERVEAPEVRAQPGDQVGEEQRAAPARRGDPIRPGGPPFVYSPPTTGSMSP